MKLSEWARKQDLSYVTAFNWFKAGKLPVKAIQTATGTILIQEEEIRNLVPRTVVYGRVSSYNKKGKFDVLPQHANFISLIQKSLVIRDNRGQTREINVNNGLMRVKKDIVEVYIGIEALGGFSGAVKD